MTETPNTPDTMYTASPEELAAKHEKDIQTKRTMIGVTLGAVVLLVLLGTAIYFLLHPGTPGEWVGKLRDVFIIVVALSHCSSASATDRSHRSTGEL